MPSAFQNTTCFVALCAKQRLNTKLKITFPIVKYVEKLVKKEPNNNTLEYCFKSER